MTWQAPCRNARRVKTNIYRTNSMPPRTSDTAGLHLKGPPGGLSEVRRSLVAMTQRHDPGTEPDRPDYRHCRPPTPCEGLVPPSPPLTARRGPCRTSRRTVGAASYPA